jgi:hypothetical protein
MKGIPILHQLPTRQRIRKALVILTFLSFPITMNYLSPYVIIKGAANGILCGIVVMFRQVHWIAQLSSRI